MKSFHVQQIRIQEVDIYDIAESMNVSLECAGGARELRDKLRLGDDDDDDSGDAVGPAGGRRRSE